MFVREREVREGQEELLGEPFGHGCLGGFRGFRGPRAFFLGTLGGAHDYQDTGRFNGDHLGSRAAVFRRGLGAGVNSSK